MKMTLYLRSFRYAFEGLWYVIKNHSSFSIEVIVACCVIAGGIYYHLTRFEWLVIVMMIFVVLSAELFNTSVEKTLDYMTTEHHIDVKLAKDIAAGAVLISAIGSVAIGLLVFWPYIFV